MKTIWLSAAVVAVLVAAGRGDGPGPERQGSLTPTQRLAREIPDVRIVEMPLSQALAYLQAQSGLTIGADWEALASAGVAKDTPVTVRQTKLPADKALDLVLESAAMKDRPLAWFIRGDQVRVSTQRAVLLRENVYPAPASADKDSAAGPTRPASARGSLSQINFDGVALESVMEFLRDVSGLNFHVNWRALEGSNIVKDTPISVKARDTSIGHALDLVIDQLNVGKDRFTSVYWLVEEGVVNVSTGNALNQSTRVQMFDIGDVVMSVPNFKAPRINLGATNNTVSNGSTGGGQAGGLFQPAGGAGIGQAGQPGEEVISRKALQDGLIDTIKNSIGEQMWAPQGKGSINILQNRLIVSQTQLGFILMGKAFSKG